MDKDEYRRSSRENWQAMAAGWERQRALMNEVTAPVQGRLVHELAPAPGDTILELAAGPGETGLEAARLVGDDGRLISTDFSSEMVEVASRRSAELGLGNVEHRVLDAEHLDLEDDSVDGVVCRFGFMLMADPEAALAETRRVLRPGGRLVLAVWRGPEQNPWVAIAGRVLTAHGYMAPNEPGAPGIFTMADEERVRSLLGAAGFSQVRCDDVPLRFTYADLDDYVAASSDTGGSFSVAFRDASDEERDAMLAEIREAFVPFAVGDGYELPGLALVAVAR